MSHFTVLVVGEDIEEKLAPFQENNMGECPEAYLVFKDQEEELRNDYATDKRTFWQAPEGTRYSTYDDRFKVKNESGFGTKSVRPHDYKEVEIPFTEIYPTFEAYMDDYHSQKPDTKTGKYGYWENPNAKWDWFQIGGRWAGFFKLKEGAEGEQGTQSWMQRTQGVAYPEGKADRAYKGDIDFEGMREEKRQQAAKDYDRMTQLLGKEPAPLEYSWARVLKDFEDKSIEEKRKIYHEQEAIKHFKKTSDNSELAKEDREFLIWAEYEDYAMSRDEYIKRAGRGAISSFAVVKDGKWYEKGSMGWWGVVSDKKDDDKWDEEYEKLLNELPDDALLTIVDCHI